MCAGGLANTAPLPDHRAMASYTDDQFAPKRRRPPPPLTPLRFRVLAEAYVQRFGGPSSNLKRYLQRQIDKALIWKQIEQDEVRAWQAEMAKILAEFQEAGAVNDARFAQGAAEVLQYRGVAPRVVAMRLRQKGIGQADIKDAIDLLGDPAAAEWQAALNLARRRRLGPYRPAEDRKERRQKDAAALARAGFSASVAFRVVDLKVEDLP